MLSNQNDKLSVQPLCLPMLMGIDSLAAYLQRQVVWVYLYTIDGFVISIISQQYAYFAIFIP
ncbi:hypothetical protein FKN90_08260 [Vibrio sp. 2017_1457_15]|nr:hypothetical protein [Vibrio sp. 2017_1457_15]MDQ2161297.1 hypothetical protein [Vibrio sp. 2017_1457_13]MDQ2189427.1 hypothetical protein [Vibrio sp. A14(2019)]